MLIIAHHQRELALTAAAAAVQTAELSHLQAIIHLCLPAAVPFHQPQRPSLNNVSHCHSF